MNTRRWFVAFAIVLFLPLAVLRADAPAAPAKEPASYGLLKAPAVDTVRAEALAWLQKSGKGDAAGLKAFERIWAETDRSLLDRVTATLELGDPAVGQILAAAADPATPAPTEVPALLKDAKRPVFYRGNLALAYAKALSNRRIHEEALASLQCVKPEQVVDPAAYFFVRAVAEHAMAMKSEAGRSIVGLLEDVADAPERYKLLAILMLYDMQQWRDKDLGQIARKMDNIERRLKLARGGPKTQKLQREVVARLDEIIKQLEKPGS